MKPLKQWLETLALAISGLAAAFLLGEVLVRVTGLAPASFYTYDQHRGWRLRPGAHGTQHKEGNAYVRVNRYGLHGPDYAPRQKPANTLRIAVLGDSFTEAKQVEQADNFCSVMERELSQCAALGGRGVQVLNFGVDGYGTAQELAALERMVWQYSPDLVMLAFFSGNDVRNNSVILEGDKCRPFFAYRNGALEPAGGFSLSGSFKLRCLLRFESRHSQLLNELGVARSAIRSKFHAWRTNMAKKPPAKGSEFDIDNFVYAEPRNQTWRDAWHVTEGLITRMRDEVARRKAGFVVVTVDSGIQSYPEVAARRKFMQSLGINTIFYPNQRIRALGEREGFPVIDLAEPMQVFADTHHVFLHGFTNTQIGFGHWNRAGHQAAGRILAQRVCELLEANGFAPARRLDAATGRH